MEAKRRNLRRGVAGASGAPQSPTETHRPSAMSSELPAVDGSAEVPPRAEVEAIADDVAIADVEVGDNTTVMDTPNETEECIEEEMDEETDEVSVKVEEIAADDDEKKEAPVSQLSTWDEVAAQLTVAAEPTQAGEEPSEALSEAFGESAEQREAVGDTMNAAIEPTDAAMEADNDDSEPLEAVVEPTGVTTEPDGVLPESTQANLQQSVEVNTVEALDATNGDQVISEETSPGHYNAPPPPAPQFDPGSYIATSAESPLKLSMTSGDSGYETLADPSREEVVPGSPTTDEEDSNDPNSEPLDINVQSAEDLQVDLSSPFSTSVNGPGCSTADDIPESPVSNLESPAQDEEYGSDFDASPSVTQSPVGPPSPQLELGSPGSSTPLADTDMLNSCSPQFESAPPSPEQVTSPSEAPSPVLAPVSPVLVGSLSVPSPPSRIVGPKAKKSTAANPPPAPVESKNITKPSMIRQTSASRLPASKSTANAPVAKPTTKPVTKSAVKPATKLTAKSTSVIATKPATSIAAKAAKVDPMKKIAPAKISAAKKSAPKAVVYNVSPAPRVKKSAAPSQTSAVDGGDKTNEAEKTDKANISAEDAKVHPKKVSKAASEAASNRLYEAAKAAKLRREARSEEVDEACTFAPKVGNTSKRPSAGETDRFAALHEEAKQLQAKKQELQRKHEEETCTFRPEITSKAKHLARDTGRPRYENLYKQARELKQKREEKALAKKEQEKEECSFKPKIKATKSPVKTKPLYDAEREKQKQALREQKKAETEMSECTFKPKVLSKKPSTKPEAGSITAEEGKIYDRLYRGGKAKDERIEKMRKEREDEEKAKAPFQPQLATAASQKTKDKEKDGEPKQKEPFHKRLYKKDHLQKTMADREQQKVEEERKFSYKPKITEVPEEIKAKQKEYTSPDKPIFERLYEDKDKIKEKLQMSEEIRQQKEMAECTFRPRVASTTTSSNGSAPSSPVWERLSICHKNQSLEEREKLRQQLEMQECTFKPVISPSDHVSPYRSPSYALRRRSSRGENCSPSFDSATRKPSVKPPRSSPDSRSSMPQFQPVSIGNILKSSTLVLTEDSTSSPDNESSSVPKRDSAFGLDESAVVEATQNSPRRPSPVHKPSDFSSSNGVSKKMTTDVDGPSTVSPPVSRSLDSEFQEAY